MYCIQCGMTLPDGAIFCPRCGAPVGAAAPREPSAGEAVAGVSERPVVVPPVAPYAGFWRRFVAVIIDQLLLVFVTFPINVMLRIPMFGWMNQDEPNMDDIMALVSASLTAILVSAVINWLYSALLESSKLQGTLGKLVLNIKVTDLEGRRISFARATGRYFGKILSSALLLIGYLIQPFTRRRQALHDLLAATLVVRRGAPE